jgi:osmotically-inducible protein OsmY
MIAVWFAFEAWRCATAATEWRRFARLPDPSPEEKSLAVSARVSSPLSVCAALLVAASLSSCIPLVLGGAAVTGGYVAGQERGVGTIASDTDIRAGINNAWYSYNSDMAGQLSLSVYDGRVLITGIVSNPDFKPQAVRLAGQVKGVKEVNDEILVSDRSTIGNSARDELIKTRLRSAVLFDGDVRSVNYTIDVINGVVYLSGSARTQAELDKVIDYARNIPNVKKVVNYARIRPGEPPAPGRAPVTQGGPAGAAPPNDAAYAQPGANAPAQPSGPQPSYAQPAPNPPPRSAGSGPIEVTPLR